jgi:hypothetical protein
MMRRRSDWPIVTVLFLSIGLVFVLALQLNSRQNDNRVRDIASASKAADAKLAANAEQAYIYACKATNQARAEANQADGGVLGLLQFLRPGIEDKATAAAVDSAIEELSSPRLPLDCSYPPKGNP